MPETRSSKFSVCKVRHRCDFSAGVSFERQRSRGKKYFIGKHKLYGYKVEVEVRPDGIAIGRTDNYAGSVSDFDIFKENIRFHKRRFKKSREEREQTDINLHAGQWRADWALLVDKEYQGALEICRAIHPKKKPQNGRLTIDEEQFNRQVSSDRIIVENYLGRLCSMWGVMDRKWKWAEDNYDDVFRLCLGLTNLHIHRKPLREEDLAGFQQVKNRNRVIGTDRAASRRAIQKRYRDRRRNHINLVHSLAIER